MVPRSDRVASQGEEEAVVSSGSGVEQAPQCAHTILKAIVPLGWVLLVVLAGLSVEKNLLRVFHQYRHRYHRKT
jgi:hypothetical protein